mgnify:FL=1
MSNTMLSARELDRIWRRADSVSPLFAASYVSLMGCDRLAVLPLLREPVQSTLHAVLQQNVVPGTRCVYRHCPGTLDKAGRCSAKCEQSGVNVVHDIMYCANCDAYGFPCTTCNSNIFRHTLKQYVEDY